MKTRMILAAMLLLAFGSARAQEKPISTLDKTSRINETKCLDFKRKKSIDF